MKFFKCMLPKLFLLPKLIWLTYTAPDGTSRLVLMRVLFRQTIYRREFVISGAYHKNDAGIGTKCDRIAEVAFQKRHEASLGTKE